MRCIIPAAGQGIRLRPHTNTKPKALLSLGNKPIISYILDNIINTGINDIIIIVGYEKEKLIKYLKSSYGDKCQLFFIEQQNRLGLGHAIYSANEFLDGEPVLIALGDSLYEKPFSEMLKEFNNYPNWLGALSVKEVPNPQAYGVVVTKEHSSIVEKLIEKPKQPISSKAITGVYIIRDSKELKKALKELIDSNNTGVGGEYQLTDALQLMVDKNLNLGVIDSGQWFDCGKKEALLSAHKYILNLKENSIIKSELDNTIIISPVAIQSECYISNSIIGPYVSIDQGTVIEHSIVSSSIIGAHSHVENAGIKDSLIGDKVQLIGSLYNINIGDYSKMQLF